MDNPTALPATGFDGRLAALRPGLGLIGLPACVLDAELRYRFLNADYLAWFGRPAEDFLGRTADEVFAKKPQDSRREQIHRALAGEPVIFNRVTLEGPNTGRWVRAHYMPLRSEDSATVGVVVILVDVQQLKDAEQRLQLVIDNIGVPMAYIGRDLRFRFANQPGLDWKIASPVEALGKPIEEIFDEATLATVRPEIEKALQGRKCTYERVAVTASGERRWIRVHLVPDIDTDGVVQGFYTLTLDVEDDHRLREAVEREESRTRFLLENIPGPIAVIGGDLRYIFANRSFKRARGLEGQDLVGRTVAEVLGPADTARYLEPAIERLRRGEACAYERLIRTPDGEGRWHLVRLVPMMDGEGGFNGYYSVGVDIHDMKLAQERLHAQEAQLRLYTDNIPDSVAYLDRDRRILFANKHFAEQRNTTPEKLIGLRTADIMGTETAAWIAQRTQKVFDRGEIATYERQLAMPDGSARWFHVKAVPDFDEAGVVRGMYVVAHDITEVKEVQEQLAAREEELRFFAENIPEAIVYVDLERGCTFVNNLFLQTRGFTREYALGKFPADVYSPEVMAELQPLIDRALRYGDSSYERRLRLPSGAERWVRVRVTSRRDGAGKPVGFYVVSTDIDDLKKAQAVIEDKERQLRQVIDSIPTPMCYVDSEARYQYVNDAFLSYIGRPASEIVGHAVREVLGEERWVLLSPILDRVREGESLAVERMIRFADGRSRWMTVRLSPRFVDGRYHGYYATTSDIHEQKLVEEELRRANTILSAHFDNTPLAVIECDTELRICRWSGQAETIFGWQASETLGRALTSLRHVYEEDEEAYDEMIRGLFEGRSRHATLLHRNYRKDGSVIWVEWHNSALHDESGRVISILSLAQDVSSRIQAEERLQYMATHDGLTGLPNSVLLNGRLDAALTRARRGKHGVGVMFLDLDHFKDVNDTLGHRVGDGLLKELARRIRATLRQSDLLARVSGDEFVVVLEDLNEVQAPDHVARKILDEVRRPFRVEGHEIHVSGSLGLALFPDDGQDAETLLKNADAAMYHAKELGRNGFRNFSVELANRRAVRVQVETALRRALRDNELSLHFQPIMDIATGEVRRAEALLRWHDPERGLVLPPSFIPLAEESGLGHAVGQWVMDNACRQARAWRESGVGGIVVCVNLSASQLRDTSMIGDLKRTLQTHGCEPGWLQLEITETSMVRDVESASAVLARLRALGVRVAIDDFGTGFSSLSHLRHLPVDVLKIDKGFVADVGVEKRGDSAGGAAIVSAVIGLARGLGLDVVAEGVERKAQLDFLAAQGCHAAQGYLICPPLAAAEFERWLLERRGGRPPRKPAAPRRKKRVTS
ncbi:MAG TPA: PAS domain-containing protein [Usitatibacter sp.]|nr:PAS domain-containing protein [Usitatibacter sp.]